MSRHIKGSLFSGFESNVGGGSLVSMDDLREQLGPFYSQMKRWEAQYVKQIKDLQAEVKRLRANTLAAPLTPIWEDLETIPETLGSDQPLEVAIDFARRLSDYRDSWRIFHLGGPNATSRGVNIFCCLEAVKRRAVGTPTDPKTFFQECGKLGAEIEQEFMRTATTSGLTIIEWLNTNLKEFHEPLRVERDPSPVRSPKL